MTASEKPANHKLQPAQAEKHTKPSMEDAPKLPGVLFLLKEAGLIVWKYRLVVYGYTAWLIIPIVIYIVAQEVPSPYGDSLLIVQNILGMVLSLWVTAAIMIYIAVEIAKEEHETINYTALGKRAWNKVLNLFIIQTLMVSLIAVGTILFAIPGIVAWVWTAFAMQEGVLTNKGVVESFKHSRELAKGRFFAIFGRLLAFNLIIGLLAGLVFTGFVVAGLYGSAGDPLTSLYAWPTWMEIGFSLIILPFTPISIIFNLCLYFAVKKSYSAANV